MGYGAIQSPPSGQAWEPLRPRRAWAGWPGSWKTIGTSTSCLGKQPTPPLPPHLPWVTPCLSREPGPALRWVQLKVDVGQKPVERSTPQSPLQLQAFCVVWLLNLGPEGGETHGSKMEKFLSYVVEEGEMWLMLKDWDRMRRPRSQFSRAADRREGHLLGEEGLDKIE